VTEKVDLEHAEVNELNSTARSEFDDNGICNRVDISFRKQSSQVKVGTKLVNLVQYILSLGYSYLVMQSVTGRQD
jgi:hypothetical protein